MGREHKQASDEQILVVGSSGKTGRRVVERLDALGVQTRPGSRRAAIPFDWDDQTTWAPALSGMQKAYVAFHPDLAVPGAPDAIREFMRLAVDAGIEHVVLLSGRGEAEARRCERIVEESGVTWTVIRASWFFQNFSEGFLRDLIVGGTVALPVGGVLEPFVDAEDIADVAVSALTGSGLNNRLVEVTGPQLMTFAQAVDAIGVAAGYDVAFVHIEHEEFLASMIREGVPGPYVQLLGYLFSEVLDGRNESLTSGVQSALGREPRNFESYAARTVEEGAWSMETAQ